MGIHVVEHCQVSPSDGGATLEQILPLSNFDIVRLHYHLLNFLFFYTFPCSQSHFLATVVPNLKNSLSLTLKHFLPLAGNIVFPLSISATPVSHYVSGDSVPVTIAISGGDFNSLTGDHSRDADQFRDLTPSALPHTSSGNSIRFSPLAVQVTLLPNQGICIAQTINHAIADGHTLLDFQHVWASINKFNGDSHLLALGQEFKRFYNTSVDAKNNHLVARTWSQVKTSPPTLSLTISLPTNKVRAAFFLSEEQIRKLKSISLTKKPEMAHTITSLVVLCGYVWSCLAKASEAVGEEVADDEVEYITCTAELRGRFNPPLPKTYFGNCTVLVPAQSTHGTLKGKEGFVSAAQAIGEAIHKIKNRRDNVFDDLEHRLKMKGKGKRVVTIAGSPRFDYYGLDYGWGRPNKMEYLTNDCDESIFLCKPRGGRRGIEIILSMGNLKMDAYSGFFHEGLTEAPCYVDPKGREEKIPTELTGCMGVPFLKKNGKTNS